MLLTSVSILCFFQAPSPELDALLGSAQGLPPADVLTLADGPALDALESWEFPSATPSPQPSFAEALCLTRLSARLGDATYGTLLAPLLEDALFRLAALSVLDMDAFRRNENAQAILSTWLQSETSSSAVAWAEGCRVLYDQGDGARRRAAVRWLKEAVNQRQGEAQVCALLALARTGATLEEEAILQLEALASGIHPNAGLAQSLIQGHAQKERFREKLEALERLYQSMDAEGDDSAITGSDDIGLLEEILKMARIRHMEGSYYTQEEMVAAAADGMLRLLDPYSTFFTGEEVGEFLYGLNPEYGGIGAYVNTVDGVFTIIRPIYSGPAYEAGLLSGDKILSVNGWSTADQPNDNIIKRLKGPPDTDVTVEIFRRGWTEARDFTMKRGRIEVPIVNTTSLPEGILYLELVSFSMDAAERVQRAIDSAMEAGDLRGVIFDLRNNPGGSLDAAVGICDLFLPAGKTVVTTRSRAGEEERLETESPAVVPTDIPLAILVNEYSASASEIVSGALSVHGRAVTVGQRTHGKGSVQTLLGLRGLQDERFRDGNHDRMHNEWEEYEDRNKNEVYDFGPRVKLTIAYYFLPDGSTIHTQRDHEGSIIQEGGVMPDVFVDFPNYEPVVLRELDRLISEERFRTYAKTLLEDFQETAVRLASYDAKDPALYPGWDAFFLSLDTLLEPDVARQWVRRNLRTLVSDLRGQVFAGSGFLGDYVEDPQLGEAIRQIISKSGLDWRNIAEYAATLEVPAEVVEQEG